MICLPAPGQRIRLHRVSDFTTVAALRNDRAAEVILLRNEDTIELAEAIYKIRLRRDGMSRDEFEGHMLQQRERLTTLFSSAGIAVRPSPLFHTMGRTPHCDRLDDGRRGIAVLGDSDATIVLSHLPGKVDEEIIRLAKQMGSPDPYPYYMYTEAGERISVDEATLDNCAWEQGEMGTLTLMEDVGGFTPAHMAPDVRERTTLTHILTCRG